MTLDPQGHCCSAPPEQGGSEGISAGEGGSGPAPPKALAITPLHAAVSAKDVPLLKSLMQAGADLELRDRKGNTALHAAILTWGHLLRNWPKARPGAQTALSRALASAELCLAALCEQGADANATLGDDSSQTTLHLAVRYRVVPAVPLLASAGADVNAKDSSGMTPLHMASGSLQEDILSSLISLGADVNAELRWSGNTPLHLATTAAALRHTRGRETPGLGCLEALLQHGADPEAANCAGQTPLHQACLYGQEALADVLLSHGADVHRRTGAGEGCLFLFLDNPLNTQREGRLLAKLLCLILPRGPAGDGRRLPAMLARPCYTAQRRSLLALRRQPRSLKDMCKNRVYLSWAARGAREELSGMLPGAMFDFVFNLWDSPGGVSFTEEEEEGSSDCPVRLAAPLSH